MKSAAYSHFPQIVFENGRKWLFNPVLKKRFKNRPEERVRLQWVEYLLHQTTWNKNRIGFETPMQLVQSVNKSRADLVLFDDNVNARILIECKADTISLGEKTAEQAARYNQVIDAEYIILTNGVEDVCYRLAGRRPSLAELPFEEINGPGYIQLDYWHKRGFCSPSTESTLNRFLAGLFTIFWKKQSGKHIQYLSFTESLMPFSMDHYYGIFTLSEERKLAVTFAGSSAHGNYLVGVLNKAGKLAGVVVVNLEKLFDGTPGSARLITQAGDNLVNASDYLPDFYAEGFKETSEKLPDLLLKFFD